jgi:hypothetical protein
VLCFEGTSFEAFVRDYRAAYTAVTGEQLLPGMTLEHAFAKMKLALEVHRNEYIIVIFDLWPYLESDIHEALDSTELYLPRWCRVIVTSSVTKTKSSDARASSLKKEPNVHFAHAASSFHVTAVGEQQVKQYLNLSGLDNTHNYKDGLGNITPLRLSIVAATMRLRKLSISQFNNVYRQTAKRRDSPKFRAFSMLFSNTMSVMWDALQDYNVVAAELLSVCSMVDRHCIPLALVLQLPNFQLREESIVGAINVLRGLGLFTMSRGEEGDLISLHQLPWRWLHFKLDTMHDSEGMTRLLQAWVVAFDAYLTDSNASIRELDQSGHILYEKSPFDATKFWQVFPHITFLYIHVKPRRLQSISSKEYMRFLKHVAMSLYEDGLLTNSAGLATSQALS